MSYYINNKVVRTLPEQVAQNQEDIAALQSTQKTDESNINTNLNNINALETRVNALDTIKLSQSDTSIKLTKSTGSLGEIKVGTVAGTNLLGGNNVTFKTINGEAITGDGNLVTDAGLSSLLWDNLGVGRWRSQTFQEHAYITTGLFTDTLMPYYTDCTSMFALAHWDVNTMTIDKDFKENSSCSYLFYGFTGTKNLKLSNHKYSEIGQWIYSCTEMFKNSEFETISCKDGCSFEIGGRVLELFFNCTKLKSISGIDFGGTSGKIVETNSLFYNCTSLTYIDASTIAFSFDISYNPNITEDEMVAILNTLPIISKAQTLKLGSENLKKLTTDDILIATGKGWQLA